MDLSQPPLPTRWNARLSLDYVLKNEKTVLATRAHEGPLRVLKTLYPEGDAVAHTIIVHPPAGVASADSLAINVRVSQGAHAVIATPGAQKWYRSRGEDSVAQSHTHVVVENNAILEWMPHEAIVYDGARGEQSIGFELAESAKLCAWEITQWGRTTRGETFTQGAFSQRISLHRESWPLWSENMGLRGGDELLRSPTGFGGHAVVGTFWVFGANDARACLSAIREQMTPTHPMAATLILPSLVCVKAVAHDAETLRNNFVRCRNLVRPFLCARTGSTLRIWHT